MANGRHRGWRRGALHHDLFSLGFLSWRLFGGNFSTSVSYGSFVRRRSVGSRCLHSFLRNSSRFFRGFGCLGLYCRLLLFHSGGFFGDFRSFFGGFSLLGFYRRVFLSVCRLAGVTHLFRFFGNLSLLLFAVIHDNVLGCIQRPPFDRDSVNDAPRKAC